MQADSFDILWYLDLVSYSLFLGPKPLSLLAIFQGQLKPGETVSSLEFDLVYRLIRLNPEWS